MTTRASHAIVIGASMAGLLAARVLSDHFTRVTILERDRFDDTGSYRPGVPQARHLHVLLIRGEQILQRLFPGFETDMLAAGAVTGRWGLDNGFFTVGGWTPTFDSGYTSHIISRASLETLVRRRVLAMPNIELRGGVEVQGLMAAPNTTAVTGVRMLPRGQSTEEILPADWVVDASGRGSKAPDWLASLGYPAPAETLIDAHCGYATRWYERPPSLKPFTMAIQPRPAHKLYRGGGLMPVEDRQIVVTLIGANGDYPPTDEAGFMDYARSLPTPALYEVVKDLQPLTPITGYRRLNNVRRHYERLPRRPEAFVVMGDAAAALNPIYGQGMTKAALEAEALDSLLREHAAQDFIGVPGQFQKRIARILDGAWLMATGEDMRYPGVEGQRPGLYDRVAHKYIDLLAYAMAHDQRVALGFFEAMSLLRDPRGLIRPSISLRVLYHTLIHRRPS
jgi:2-polyprenyl-6-methoxyphenol hydroxylase-like FAD-dependent oxidoreductase